MGKKGKMIVKLDTDKLVEELNRALADEWLAFYSYWLSSHIVNGRSSLGVAELFQKIAQQELEHASELANRISELGGFPLNNPNQWQKKAHCAYTEPPEDPTDVEAMLKDAADAEVCAIEVYNKLADKTAGGDIVTHQLVVHILTEEVAHEESLENLLS